MQTLVESYDAWRMHHSAGFFLLHQVGDAITVHALADFQDLNKTDGKVCLFFSYIIYYSRFGTNITATS